MTNNRWQPNNQELTKIKLSRESKELVSNMFRFTPSGYANWPTTDYTGINEELTAKGIVIKRDAEFCSHASYEIAARFVM